MHYLGDLISRYLIKYTHIFGSDSLIPKHHVMLHYPDLIEIFGPLRNIWTMRFEARHQYIKRLKLSNFINITHTIANRNQYKLAYHLNNINSILNDSHGS